MAKNADNLRTKLHRELPFAHPIKEHPIDKCEEFVKKLYMDMLCVIAQYENSDTEFALNFVQRIMAGAEMKEPVTEHVKNAMEITEERFDEFLRQCRENKLENIFVVDAMLISCADGKPNVKQVEFISETLEALFIKKEDICFICDICSTILTQDNSKYPELYDKAVATRKLKVLEQFMCYLKEFVSGIIIDTDDLLYIYSPSKKPISLQMLEKYFKKHRYEIWSSSAYDYEDAVHIQNKMVIFENVIFDFDRVAIDIQSCPNFIARNCEFNGLFFYLRNDYNVTFDNSIFTNTRESVFKIEDMPNGNVTVNSCRFENVGSAYLYNGVLFYRKADRIGDFSFFANNSDFINCTCAEGNYSVITQYIGKGRVTNCRFENCFSQGARLFQCFAKDRIINCTFKGCNEVSY